MMRRMGGNGVEGLGPLAGDAVEGGGELGALVVEDAGEVLGEDLREEALQRRLLALPALRPDQLHVPIPPLTVLFCSPRQRSRVSG